jgi:putative hydrolase of the HAD superfamily
MKDGGPTAGPGLRPRRPDPDDADSSLTANDRAAVLFDFGGTLDADGLPWKERMSRLFREEGAVVPHDRFDPAFYTADDALVGALAATTSFQATVERLAAGVAQALELSDPYIAARVSRRFLGDSLEALDGNTPLLRELGRRYRLGIVSNFYGNLAQVCDDAGIRPLFGALVDSAEVGCTKPAPRIFQLALDALGVSAAKATFVGDSLPRDMAGARGVGMPHIWLVGAEPSAAAPCCRDDRQIRSLRELKAILL